jgi:hypothetical protein
VSLLLLNFLPKRIRDDTVNIHVHNYGRKVAFRQINSCFMA